MATRVLIADDAAVIRRAVRHILETSPDIAVVGEVAELPALELAITHNAPDVVVADFNLLGPDVKASIRSLKQANSRTKIVIITAFAQGSQPPVGADRLLDKIYLGEQLLPAVKALSPTA